MALPIWRARAFATTVFATLTLACVETDAVVSLSTTGDSIHVTASNSTGQIIQISDAPLVLRVGEVLSLQTLLVNALGYAVSASDVTWVSADPATATVSAAGQLEGKAAGETTVTALAEDLSAVVDVIVEPDGSLTILTRSLPDGFVGQPYDRALTAGGATQSVGWTLASGSLPEGLEFGGSGRISGTPLVAGTSSFTVRAVSGEATDTQELSIEVLPPGATRFPNEPPGMTEIFYMDGTTKDWGPLIDLYGVAWGDPAEGGAGPFTGNVSVLDDADAPNGRAVQQDWPVGRGSGFNGVPIMDWTDEFGYQSEIFIRLGFRYSSNWQQHSGIDKIFYYGAGSTGTATEFFPAVRGGGQILAFRVQSGSTNNTMFGSTGRIVWGDYHVLEIHHVANSASGIFDGSLRVWLDGELVQEWDDFSDGVNQLVDLSVPQWEWIGLGETETGFKGGQFAPYWGGSGDVKQVADWFRWGELYISGKR